MKDGLFENLKAYSESDYYPFHMPGHKRNSQSGPLSTFYACDITEIDGFDNLHQPEGIIRKAQERAAALYHSGETYFLVNGSTSGILSAISAVADRGSKLIVARNCHKAVYHAAFLNHMELRYLYPKCDKDFGIAGGIKACQVEEAITEIMKEACRESGEIQRKEGIRTETGAEREASGLIAGIVITSPTYDGISSEISEIVKTAHHYQIPVIVDQAHGAHFGFHPAFPKGAVTEGADLVIHSVHKTLPAPTQTALIHRNGNLVSTQRLRRYLGIYQTSSPSYLLMAGIDSAMALLETEGWERLDSLLARRSELEKKAEALSCIRILPMQNRQEQKIQEQKKSDTACFRSEADRRDRTQYVGCEPGKLVISVRGSGFTGQWLYHRLREDYHLQMEMCGEDYVLAILSMMDTKEGFDRLWEALRELDDRMKKDRDGMRRMQSPENGGIGTTEPKEQAQKKTAERDADIFPRKVWEFWQACTLPYQELPFKNAQGMVAADFINLYPPGIPILVPGERLDRNQMEKIRKYLADGFHVQGISEEGKVRVLKEVREYADK